MKCVHLIFSNYMLTFTINSAQFNTYFAGRGEVVLERLYQQAGNLSIYSIMEQNSPQFLNFRHVLLQKIR